MWRENLRKLVQERGQGNMKGVSLRAGLGPTAVRDILTGRVRDTSITTLEALAAALGVHVTAIVGNTTYLPGTRNVQYIRVKGEVQAGSWRDVSIAAFDEYDLPIPVDSRWPPEAVFALEVRGNSINRKAKDGDWVVCLAAESAPRPYQSGDWVIVERKDGDRVETTVKEVRWDQGWELWPSSSDDQWQQPIRLKLSNNGTEVRVVAFVLDFVSSGTKF